MFAPINEDNIKPMTVADFQAAFEQGRRLPEGYQYGGDLPVAILSPDEYVEWKRRLLDVTPGTCIQPL